MAEYSLSVKQENGSISRLEEVKLEQDSSISTDSISTSMAFSSWNSEPGVSDTTGVFNDPFEGILHRTHASESKYSIEFISSRFFEAFKQKIHADYTSSVDIDSTNYVSKCTTHIKGAKCDIKLDSHFKTMEVSGIGFRLWREERFPKISQALFKRLMQELDSEIAEPSQLEEHTAEDLENQRFVQEEQICNNITNDVNIAPNCNVKSRDAVSSNVALGVAPIKTTHNENNSNTCVSDTHALSIPTQTVQLVFNDVPIPGSVAQPNGLFTAENITQSYKSGVIATNSTQDPVPTPVRCNTTRPVLTSTPIVQRPGAEMTINEEPLSPNITLVLKRIEQLESGIKTIKRDILHHMESKLDELKFSIVNMIENTGPNVSYASAVRNNASDLIVQQSTSGNMPTSILEDEGYGDQSGDLYSSSSSQTHVKRPFVAIASRNEQRSSVTTTPKPIPVHVTDRNVPIHTASRNTGTFSQPRPTSSGYENQRRRKETTNSRTFSTHQERTLLLGDSVIKGINPRGLKKGITICARGGATIQDIYDNISVYDMKSFSHVIVSVGGNDCSSRADINVFEDKYSQLIDHIKNANSSCAVYLCKVVPRGDVDVSAFNHTILRLADRWATHQVSCIEDTYNLFLGRNRVPTRRYYARDGIHLSHSGIRRLLDALNRKLDIVSNFELCVFQSATFRNKRTVRPGASSNEVSGGQSGGDNGYSRLNGRRSYNRFCQGCNMTGHSDTECWYAQ